LGDAGWIPTIFSPFEGLFGAGEPPLVLGLAGLVGPPGFGVGGAGGPPLVLELVGLVSHPLVLGLAGLVSHPLVLGLAGLVGHPWFWHRRAGPIYLFCSAAPS